MAFRRERSPFDRMSLVLSGISGGEYTVRNLDSGESYITGGELEIVLKEKRSSVILEYKAN